MTFKLLALIVVLGGVWARDDGLVRTPPMGWLSWTRYLCETDCKRYPKACINEDLYKAQADALVSGGYDKLGYNYVNIDDCWSEMQRDSQTKRLVPNKQRFPSGMKALADYMHQKGLKLGIYGDVGDKTCAGYPSQNNHNGSNYFDIDAKTFAEWGIDSFKFDGCNEDPHHFDKLFPEMGKAIKDAGRPMVFICEWPLYQGGHHDIKINYQAITDTCHVFRNAGDIQGSWSSIEKIINFYGDNNELFQKYNGPGHFFDPDMIVVGDYGVSHEQSRTHMSMWAMFSAPLYMSNDLRDISKEDKDILQNKAVIAVNQDKNGFMAKRVAKQNTQQYWTKRVEPQVNGQWSYAVVYFDSNMSGDKHYMSQKVSTLIPDAKPTTEYVVHDLYQDEGKDILSTLKANDNLELLVKTGGGCRMVKLVPK